jgi:hypothetical protein
MLSKRITMKSRSRRIVIGTFFGVAFISLLALGGFTTGNRAGLTSTVRAQEAIGFKCSDATLTGRYSFSGHGFAFSPPSNSYVPFAVAGLLTFDGAGGLSDQATANNNGTVTSNINPGTYTVNEDCTGTLTVTIPFPPYELTHALFIADKGNEFYLVTTSRTVVTLAGKRLH